jgi:catechol 2,3-dioxygenase-like lactoylglutathione lyase family enzyme
MARIAPVRLGHISLEVASIDSACRYHDRFLGILGFRRFQDGEWYLGYRRGPLAIWFFRRGRIAQVRRERPKVPLSLTEVIPEHVGFAVASWDEIARWEDRLRNAGLEPLYPVDRGPPRASTERYRSAAWVDPDRIVWEIYAERRRPAAPAGRRRARSLTSGSVRARRRPSAGRAR